MSNLIDIHTHYVPNGVAGSDRRRGIASAVG